jgi:hypothetical protein
VRFAVVVKTGHFLYFMMEPNSKVGDLRLLALNRSKELGIDYAAGAHTALSMFGGIEGLFCDTDDLFSLRSELYLHHVLNMQEIV